MNSTFTESIEGHNGKVKVLLFDFDGTIADSFPLFLQGMRFLSRFLRFPYIKDEDVPKLRRMPVSQILNWLGLGTLRQVILTSALRFYMTVHYESIPIHPKAVDLLKFLKSSGLAHIPMGILSSNGEKLVMAWLGGAGIYNSFLAPIQGEVSLSGKAVMLKKYAQSLGIAPSEILYFGDEIRDYHACVEAGVPCVLVSWGYNHPSCFDEFECPVLG